ncbi:methyltransferase [Actinomadura fulvescens]|uniref:Methyltransferase type 12 domain-containing protein n=1 Tax=Actinomadura fulvescens TaxID=46160 RepID=A0ABN3QGN3_9ACTN
MTVPDDSEITRLLTGHPWIGAAQVDPGGRTVRVRAAESAVAVRPALGGLVEEFLEHWSEVYEWTYTKGENRHADDLDLSGWRASDTGEPLPVGHMREWIGHTVELVLSLKPRWILELGCGTGLLAHRLRDRVSGYVGTDVADAAVRALTAEAEPGTAFVRAAAHEAGSPQVRMALETVGCPQARPDCVVLNSVTQCFPGVDYLRSVVQDAVELVAPGGTIVVGDVRDARLLPDFCQWVERSLDPAATAGDLARRAAERAARDPEFLFDPPLLAGLAREAAAETGRAIGISVHPKTMSTPTELTRYRFDAVLHVDVPGSPQVEVERWNDLRGDRSAALSLRLARGPVRVEGIPSTMTGAALKAIVGGRAAILADPSDPTVYALVAPPEAAPVPVGTVIAPGTAHEPFAAFVARRLPEVATALLRRTGSTAALTMVAEDLTGPEDRAARAGARSVRSSDSAAIPGFLRRLDEVALLAMAATLRSAGLARRGPSRTSEEICDELRVAGRHRWIVRRWLDVLVAEGLLARSPDGTYGELRRVRRSEAIDAAAGLEAAGEEIGYPAETTRFMVTAMIRLPALLRDDLRLQQLLFAEDDTADGAYRENTVNRYLNGAAGEVMRWAHETSSRARPLRVLELGAGVGGTTTDVLAALAGREIDYLFTDVSRYFLTLGRKRFGGRPGVGFELFDINHVGTRQPRPPASFDVILSANVLHNARDIRATLEQLAGLLSPGGLFVFIETTRELSSILTSMQFLMSPRPGQDRLDPADPRAGGDRVFLTGDEWLEELTRSGLEPLFSLPHCTHPLAAAGLRLFVARAARQAGE